MKFFALIIVEICLAGFMFGEFAKVFGEKLANGHKGIMMG